MQDPVERAERDVVTEVVESTSLVFSLAERTLVVLWADNVLQVWVDVWLIGQDNDFKGWVILFEW